jgi:hypothetical protein
VPRWNPPRGTSGIALVLVRSGIALTLVRSGIALTLVR